MRSRRASAPAALVALAALASSALSGCVVLPSVAPVASPSTVESQGGGAEPSGTATPSGDDSDAAPTTDAVPGEASNTVDDGVGDTWTYAVVDVERSPALDSGAAPDGFEVLAVVLDATHDEGYARWRVCFDVRVETADGVFSSIDDASLAVVPAGDASDEVLDFTGGRIAVVVPEGTTTGSIVVVSVYGDDARSFPL